MFTILHENLGMFSKWMPRLLTVEQMHHAVKLHAQVTISPNVFYKSDSSDSYLFANFKRMLQEKTFGSKSEVIAITEACFKVMDKLFYQERIKTSDLR